MTNALITIDDFISRISECWQRSVIAIVEVGRLLCDAKVALEHGNFELMISDKLPFGPRSARMLMTIARDPRITNPKIIARLPAHWATLHELTKLDDEQFEARLADGTIRPEMERAEVIKGRVATRRIERLDQMRDLAANPLALPQGPFAAGIVDPPWEDPDSPIGFSDRHYRNKYATMTPTQVAAMPVKDIFAPTAFMALWITRHILAIGSHVEVLKAWGFEPNTIVTWDKEWIGLGNGYVRDRTEHLVFATRGKPPAPGPELRPDSLFAIRRSGKHSEKPLWMHERIEEWFPGMSYVELFGRGAARKGWAVWGKEAVSAQSSDATMTAPAEAEQTNSREDQDVLPDHDPTTGEIIASNLSQPDNPGGIRPEHKTTNDIDGLQNADNANAGDDAQGVTGGESAAPNEDDGLDIPAFLRRSVSNKANDVNTGKTE